MLQEELNAATPGATLHDLKEAKRDQDNLNIAEINDVLLTYASWDPQVIIKKRWKRRCKEMRRRREELVPSSSSSGESENETKVVRPKFKRKKRVGMTIEQLENEKNRLTDLLQRCKHKLDIALKKKLTSESASQKVPSVPVRKNRESTAKKATSKSTAISTSDITLTVKGPKITYSKSHQRVINNRLPAPQNSQTPRFSTLSSRQVIIPINRIKSLQQLNAIARASQSSGTQYNIVPVHPYSNYLNSNNAAPAYSNMYAANTYPPPGVIPHALPIAMAATTSNTSMSTGSNRQPIHSNDPMQGVLINPSMGTIPPQYILNEYQILNPMYPNMLHLPNHHPYSAGPGRGVMVGNILESRGNIIIRPHTAQPSGNYCSGI